MSEEKFSQGEWKAILTRVYLPDGRKFWMPDWGEGEDFDRQIANAHLVSAAPNMFKELWISDDLLRDALKRLPVDSGLYREIKKQLEANKKALMKARGEA